MSCDVSPAGVGPPVVAFRIVARLAGSALAGDSLTINIVEVVNADGVVLTVLNQPMVLTLQRGDVARPAEGDVDIIDAMYGAQYIVGIRPLDDICLLNLASVHDDDSRDIANITDCMYIAQYVIGMRNEYFELVP